MQFTKMEGLGNDYVYVDDLAEELTDLNHLAQLVSDRHFGIGSDGLIVVRPSQKADFKMRMFNADGSEGKMCGNGIRCFSKFVHDQGLIPSDVDQLTIETLSGIKVIDLIRDDSQAVVAARVNMGAPLVKASDIPITTTEEKWIDYPLSVGDQLYHMTGVSMGNPHIVTYINAIETLNNLPLAELGPLFEHHDSFPERINTEFVVVNDRNELTMRVWERGSGETLACGTGACATVVSSVLNKLTDHRVTVHLLGGDLTIEWDKDGSNDVFMTGPATTVFTGTYHIESVKEGEIYAG